MITETVWFHWNRFYCLLLLAIAYSQWNPTLSIENQHLVFEIKCKILIRLPHSNLTQYIGKRLDYSILFESSRAFWTQVSFRVIRVKIKPLKKAKKVSNFKSSFLNFYRGFLRVVLWHICDNSITLIIFFFSQHF